MRTFKRIAAWIMVVLSVLGIVVALGGFVGSWVVRNMVTDVTVNLLTVGETAVSSVSGGLNRIDNRLDVSQRNIATLEGNIISAGDNLSDTSIVGTLLVNNISDETAASITEAKATAVTIADSVAAIDEAINAANEIPFVNFDGLVPTLVGDVADGLDQLEKNMIEFRVGVQERREERVAASVDFFTGLTGEMSDGIDEVQTSLSAADTQLATTSANLADAKVTLPRIFTLITLAVNVLLLLVGAAFISLLMHSWAMAQNPDLTFQALMLPKKE